MGAGIRLSPARWLQGDKGVAPGHCATGTARPANRPDPHRGIPKTLARADRPSALDRCVRFPYGAPIKIFCVSLLILAMLG
jgi:hypothetical protein